MFPAFDKRHYNAECRFTFGKNTIRQRLIKEYKNPNILTVIPQASTPVMPLAAENQNSSLLSTGTDNQVVSSINSLQTSEYTPVRKTRSKTGNTISFAYVCFICNEVRVTDSTHKYRDGGLGTCESESAAQRLIEASQNIPATEHRFYTAKQRLDILLGGQSFDVWPAEIT